MDHHWTPIQGQSKVALKKDNAISVKIDFKKSELLNVVLVVHNTSFGIWNKCSKF